MNNKELIDSIKKIIDNTSNEHPYKQVGNRDSYSQYNEAWSDACDILGNRIIDKLKSINSTRRSERRAIGSNSKAVELCCYCHARPVAYNSWLCQFCIDEYNKEKQSGSIASR